MRTTALFLTLAFFGCASTNDVSDGSVTFGTEDLSMKPAPRPDLSATAMDLAQPDDGGTGDDSGQTDDAAPTDDGGGDMAMAATGDMAMTATGDMAMAPSDMAGTKPVDMAMKPSDMAGTKPVDMAMKPSDMAGMQPMDMAQAAGDGGTTCHPVINEVQTGGINGSDEFIEVVNPCQAAVDVTNWTLNYRSANNTNPASGNDTNGGFITFMGMLKPNVYVVVCGQSFAGLCDANYGTGVMSGTAGAVGLRDANGKLVDSVAYGIVAAMNAFIETKAAAAPAASDSIERLPDGVDTDNNSKDFTETMTPTPKKVNK